MNQTNSHLLQCPFCGAKNRIPADRDPVAPNAASADWRWGKKWPATRRLPPLISAAMKCGTKNRIPAAKIDEKPKCGKCKIRIKHPGAVCSSAGVDYRHQLRTWSPHRRCPFVYAWAPWCPTCIGFSPIVEAFARESKGKIRVGKLNVDANPTLSSRFGISSIPMLLIFDNGKLRESSGRRPAKT